MPRAVDPSDLPPLLPDAVLARRAALPVKPDAVALVGEIVMLHPMDVAADAAALFAASSGAPYAGSAAYDAEALIWRWMAGGPFADAASLGAWLTGREQVPDTRAFTVRHRASGLPIGAASMIANQPAHLKIELGTIWYTPGAQGTGASREVTELLLAHCFGLGYRRVEWKCDALNVRSRAAARSYGFTFEGIQEAHYINKGRNRDTAWFRMLAAEWDARPRATGS